MSNWDEKRARQIKSILHLLILFSVLLLISFYTAKLSTGLGLDPSLFAPALIAVLGSFSLYFIRQHRLKTRTETAIKTELEQMEDLDTLQTDFQNIQTPPPNGELPAEKVPTAESLPTHFYESNNAQLSLLEPWVYSKVVEFYTIVLRHKPTLKKIHGDSSPPMVNQEDLYDDADKLQELRQELLNYL